MDFVSSNDKFKSWKPLFTCLLGTGCRIGEMLGLRWEDIDWEEKVISINHNILFRKCEGDEKSEYRISTPKTKSGIRFIPLFSNVRQELQAEYERQSKTGFCHEVIDGYSGFIWQNRYGKVLTPYAVNRIIKRIIYHYNMQEIRSAGMEGRQPVMLPDFSVHNLRHTFCTRLCEQERDLKIIQEIMGHSNITTTMDVYNESSLDRKRESFNRLEAESGIF